MTFFFEEKKHAVSDCRNVVPTNRRGVYTEYTPAALHHEQHSLLTSTDMKCVLMAQGTNCSIIFVRINITQSVIRSAMSSSCWSLPHLLSSSPQHEAPPGQHDLLQDDPVPGEPLPKTTWSESNAKEPLSHINYESGGNLRPNTPTGYEPKEPKTSIDYTMYRLIEEVKELGQI